MKAQSRLKVRRVIEASTAAWPRMRAAVRRLSDAELAEADRLERLGQRRINMLRVLLAELQRRQGRGHKTVWVESEAQR